MGLLFDFYAGRGRELGEAYQELDFDRLEDLSRGHADLSLHISPRDLDLLSEQAFRIVGKEAVGVFDSFAQNVGRTDAGSADVMNPQWVAVLAEFPETQIEQLTDEWMESVRQESGETLEVTPEARKAVSALVAVCRIARQQGLDVVFTWSP